MDPSIWITVKLHEPIVLWFPYCVTAGSISIFSQCIHNFSRFSPLFHIFVHVMCFGYILQPFLIDSYGWGMPELPCPVLYQIIMLPNIWLQNPSITIQNNSLERKSRFKALWNAQAQKEPQVLWFILFCSLMSFSKIYFVHCFYVFVSFYLLKELKNLMWRSKRSVGNAFYLLKSSFIQLPTSVLKVACVSTADVFKKYIYILMTNCHHKLEEPKLISCFFFWTSYSTSI